MRILAVKTHAFGDALLTTPAVRGLIQAGHSVTVVAGPSSAAVWERFPGLEGVMVSPAPCGFVRLFRWSVANRKAGFQKAIHFGSSRKAAVWTRFMAGCPVVSGSDPSVGFGLVEPAAADYCRIAGVTAGDLKPVFPVSERESAFADRLIDGSPCAVLAPGGGRNPREFVPEKRWPMERWNSVSSMLMSRGMRVFVVGGPEDAEDISGVPGIHLAGKLTWGQTAALISRAALFCGNDSGPAHLAVSASVPAVVLFGPTKPGALYPRGSIVPVASRAGCSPCYSNSVFPGCSRGRSCMEDISVETVMNTIEGILSR